MEAYPNAKIILTTRDEEAWLASMNATLFAPPQKDGEPPSFFSHFKDWHFGPQGERGEGNVRAIKGFRRHEEDVKRWAREASREVLVNEVKDGWGPLCRFLGRDVPEVEFPRSDDWAEKGWKKVVEPAKQSA